jgi:hypothetical protein
VLKRQVIETCVVFLQSIDTTYTLQTNLLLADFATGWQD